MNKKIAIVFVILIIISIIVFIFLNNNTNKVDFERSEVDNVRNDIVIVDKLVIQNEDLLDEFIKNQDVQDSKDLKLEFDIDGKSTILQLIKNGSSKPIVENEGIYWYYVLNVDGKDERKFPAYMYKVERRIEDVDGGIVVTSILVRNEDMGAIYPLDFCRYSLKNSHYSE